MRAALALLGTLFVGALASPASAAPPKEDAAFAQRLAALSKKHDVIRVQMKPTDDAAAPVDPAVAAGGVVEIAGGRMDIYTPPLLSPQDISTVVQRHMTDIRTCYKAQLAEDPEWADRLILDLAIKKTGRVSEVSVAPGRVKKAKIGQCLMRSVPKWTFPKFTGETDDGISQEVVNASFPFSFSVD